MLFLGIETVLAGRSRYVHCIFNLILCNMCICWCVGDIFSRYRDKTECYGMFLEFATCYYALKNF